LYDKHHFHHSHFTSQDKNDTEITKNNYLCVGVFCADRQFNIINPLTAQHTGYIQHKKFQMPHLPDISGKKAPVRIVAWR